MSEDHIHFSSSVDDDYSKIGGPFTSNSHMFSNSKEQQVIRDIDDQGIKTNDAIHDTNSNFVLPPKIVSSFTSPSSPMDVTERTYDLPSQSSNDCLLTTTNDVNQLLSMDKNLNKRAFNDSDSTDHVKRQQIKNVVGVDTDIPISFDTNELDLKDGLEDASHDQASYDLNSTNFSIKFESLDSVDTPTSAMTSDSVTTEPASGSPSSFQKNGNDLAKSKVIKFTPNRTTENIKKPHLLLTNPNSKKSKREPTKGPPKNSRFFKVYTLDGSKASKPSSIHHYNPYRYPQNRSKLNPHPDFIRNKKDDPITGPLKVPDVPNADAVQALTKEVIDSVSKYENKIPELKPSIEEFEDIYSYINSIKEIGEKYGAVKIIPPKEFSPKFAINLESFWIKSKRQLWRSPSEELNARCEFYKQLKDCLKETGSISINKLPCIDKRAIDLYRLYRVVKLRGGFDNCCNDKLWAQIGRELGFYGKISSSLSSSIKSVYQKYITPWENSNKDKNQDFLNLARNDEKNSLPFAPGTVSPSDIPVILGSSAPVLRNRNTLINAGFSTYYDQATTQKKGITLNDLQTLPDFDFYHWSDPLSVDDTNPTELKISSLYTLKQFYDKSRILKSQVLNKFYEPEHYKFENLNYLESTFWKLLENPDVTFETEVAIGQSTNIHDSSYENRFLSEKNGDLSDSILGSLNFNNTTIADGSVLQYVNCDSESIYHSSLNFSMFYGTQSWCLEDHWFYNIDYHYLGDAKSVYVIPPEYQEQYEALIKSKLEARRKEGEKTAETYKLFEKEIANYDIYTACLENQVCYDMNLPRARPNDLGFEPLIESDSNPTRFNGDIMFSPEYLKKNGIPVYHAYQEVGDIIIKFPKAYTAYFSLGTSVTESVNIANTDWLKESINVSKWLQRQQIPPRFSTFAMLLTASRESKDVNLLSAVKDVLDKLVNDEIMKRNEIRTFLKEIKFGADCSVINLLNEIKDHENETGISQDMAENDDETVGTKLAFKLGNWNKVTDYDLADMFPTFVCARNIANKQSNFTMSLDAFLTGIKNDESKKYAYEMISLVDDEYLYETLDILKGKLQGIKEWTEKYHQVLAEYPVPPLEKILSIFEQGETIFDQKNVKFDQLDETDRRSYEEFICLKSEVNRTEEWRKKVKYFFGLKNQGVGELLPFSDFKKMAEDASLLTISTKETKDVINLAKEIVEFERLVAEPLSKGRDQMDLDELKKLHIIGNEIRVELESFKVLDKVVKRNCWIDSVQNKNINSLENLKGVIDEGKRLSPSNEADIKLLQDLEKRYKKAKEVNEKYQELKQNQRKISIGELKNLHDESMDAPLDEIRDFTERMIKEHDFITINILPFIKLLREKDAALAAEKEFPEKSETFLRYHEKINKNMSVENIENSIWGLANYEDLENDGNFLKQQIIEGPEDIMREINESFQSLLLFGKDDFNFSNMNKSDCLNYLASYNMDLLNSNEDRYCMCRQMHEGNMVECENCKQWFHFNCIGYVGNGSQDDSSKYVCPLCDYENRYSTTHKFYADVSAKIKFEQLMEFADRMMKECSILADYEITFLRVVNKFYSFYRRIVSSEMMKLERPADGGPEQLVVVENDVGKLRRLLQKIGACTINYDGLHRMLRERYCQLCVAARRGEDGPAATSTTGLADHRQHQPESRPEH